VALWDPKTVYVRNIDILLFCSRRSLAVFVYPWLLFFGIVLWNRYFAWNMAFCYCNTSE